MTDDRVTLPLTKVRAAAETLCAVVCVDPWTGEVLPGGHDTNCLMPLLAERDLMAALRASFSSVGGEPVTDIKAATARVQAIWAGTDQPALCADTRPHDAHWWCPGLPDARFPNKETA